MEVYCASCKKDASNRNYIFSMKKLRFIKNQEASRLELH